MTGTAADTASTPKGKSVHQAAGDFLLETVSRISIYRVERVFATNALASPFCAC